MIAEKYEWLTPPENQPALAMHRRLGREVVIHRLSMTDLSEPQRQQVRDTVSMRGQLDHPVIPHLVDFVEENGTAYCVVESFPRDTQVKQQSILDTLWRFEQIAEALEHAATHGIHHQRLDWSAIGVDALGHPRLLRLGIEQLSEVSAASCNKNERRPTKSDLEGVLTLLDDCVLDWERRPVLGTEESENRSRQFEEIGSLLKLARADPSVTLSRFVRSLRAWLQRERQLLAAKKLSFEAGSDDEDAHVLHRGYSKRVPLAIGGAGILAMLLSVAAFWPSGKSEPDGRFVAKPTEVEAEPTPLASQETNTALLNSGNGNASLDPASPTGTKSFASDLSDVGVLNQQNESLKTGAVAPKPSADRDNTMSAESTSRRGSSLASPIDIAGSEQLAAPPQVAVEPLDMDAVDESEGNSPATVSEPFAGSVVAALLPPTGQTRAHSLVQTQLKDKDGLTVELVGSPGAYGDGEFKIAATAAGWTCSLKVSERVTEIATLDFKNGELLFRWQAGLGKLAMPASHFCNVVLRLRHGDKSHALILREYESRPAVAVDLERRKPYDITTKRFPSSDDVMVEFVGSDKADAQAFPMSIIPADGKMAVGLDGGREALVVLQIQPKLKVRTQSLAIRAKVRVSSESRWNSVRSGTEARLRSDLAVLARSLYQLKTTKSKLKDNAKKAADQRIALMEEQKERLELFAKAYASAAKTDLQFRVFRQVGPYRVPLLSIGSD